VSFILDALRKSEHERQRAAVPGLAQVPLATPQPQMPRWALAVIAGLAAAVLALAVAWWQSTRAPAETPTAAPTIERRVELPQTAAASSAGVQAAPARPAAASEPRPATDRSSALEAPSSTPLSLERAAAASVAAVDAAERPAGTVDVAAPAPALSPLDPTAVETLPSAAALAAEGVALPPLRLELHAYSTEHRDRFVFINGRKYVEGERLVEGPQLQVIEPRGAVLTHAGRRFLLVQE